MDPVLKTRLEMEALQARLNSLYPNVPVPQTAPLPTNLSSMKQQQQRQPHPPEYSNRLAHLSTSPRPGTIAEIDQECSEEEEEEEEREFTLEQLVGDGSSNNRPWRKASIASNNSKSMAMSMSLGEMTDASNLSAMFEDSMRIGDDPLAKAAAKVASPTPPRPTTTAIKPDKNGLSASMMNFDMSVATIGDTPGTLEGSSMNISYSHVFDESTDSEGLTLGDSLAPEKRSEMK
jgi:hypothetical protein